MLVLGEHVTYLGREAIVACTSPYVLRMLDFHSYVPLTRLEDAISTGRIDETASSVPSGVHGRIVKYLRDRDHTAPLAEPTGSYMV